MRNYFHPHENSGFSHEPEFISHRRKFFSSKPQFFSRPRQILRGVQSRVRLGGLPAGYLPRRALTMSRLSIVWL